MPLQPESKRRMKKFLFFNIMMKIHLAVRFSLAFYFAREYYTMVRELPAGKGFADICMIPRNEHLDKPAIVIELKWDKSAVGALEQIKEKTVWKCIERLSGKFTAGWY